MRALLGLCLLAGACSHASPPPRHLLLVTVDTLRADAHVLDALAARGQVFENAFTPRAMTFPALCSLVTAVSRTCGCLAR